MAKTQLSDREILLLTKQMVEELKEDFKNLKEDMAHNYATKAEVTSLAATVALAATKAELDILSMELRPYMMAGSQIFKIIITAIVSSVLAIAGYSQFIK